MNKNFQNFPIFPWGFAPYSQPYPHQGHACCNLVGGDTHPFAHLHRQFPSSKILKKQVDTSHKIRARDVIHETRHLFFVTGKIFKVIYYTTKVKRMRIGISEPLLEESEIKKRFLSLVIPQLYESKMLRLIQLPFVIAYYEHQTKTKQTIYSAAIHPL